MLSFTALEKKIQLTHFCNKAFFQHLVIAGYHFTIRPDEDDEWRNISLLCRENLSSRSYPKTKALAAVPEGTTIGPVLEVHIVEILDGYGMEFAIQSFSNPENTSHVVIAREAERFVSEIHDHKQELRSCNELLADLQGSGRTEVYEERKVTKSFLETWASPRRKLVQALSSLLQGRHPFAQEA